MSLNSSNHQRVATLPERFDQDSRQCYYESFNQLVEAACSLYHEEEGYTVLSVSVDMHPLLAQTIVECLERAVLMAKLHKLEGKELTELEECRLEIESWLLNQGAYRDLKGYTQRDIDIDPIKLRRFISIHENTILIHLGVWWTIKRSFEARLDPNYLAVVEEMEAHARVCREMLGRAMLTGA